MTFPELLEHCARNAYPEPRSPVHDQITELAVNWVSGSLKAGTSVLDVGCGAGYASQLFQALGHKPTAVSVLEKEVKDARKLGFPAHQCEMHALSTLGTSFGLIWLRHVAEHSPCPLLLLMNCHEITEESGLLYLEIPLPWTSALHECNPDHYSVLNVLAWENLLRRAGWIPLAQNKWPMIVETGPDCYHSFICRKQPLQK